MSRSAIEYLQHILAEIEFLQAQLPTTSRERLPHDPVLKRAVVRSLEIIGEAIKQVPTELKATYPEVA